MRKGNAYRAADGSVYFRISSFPEYGALSRIKGARAQGDQQRRSTPTTRTTSATSRSGRRTSPRRTASVRWPGPGGAAEGRPGWHIECSAMIRKHLGETIDLHTGRRRPPVPASRERDRPEPVLQRRNFRPPLVPQRAPAGRRHDDEQEQGQLLHAGRPGRQGILADGRALRPPGRPSPQAAQLHARLPARGRERRS